LAVHPTSGTQANTSHGLGELSFKIQRHEDEAHVS
jgi:hypothetical protein